MWDLPGPGIEPMSPAWALVTQRFTFTNTHRTGYTRLVQFTVGNLTLIVGGRVTSRSKNDFRISGLGPGRMESPLAKNEKHERRNIFLGEI